MKRLSETEQLESQLVSLGKTIRRQYIFEGLIRLTSFILLGLVGLFILDYIARMPIIIRLFIVIVGIGYGVFWFAKNFYKKYKRELSAQEVSLMVEKVNPDLQSRMISTLQFQKLEKVGQGTSENLVEGLVNQTFDMVRNIQFTKAIDKGWVKDTFKLFAMAMVTFLIASTISINSFLVFFQRFIDSDRKYPTKTKIINVNFENVNQGATLRIPEGEKIFIKLTAQGELPPVGRVNVQAASGGEIDYDLNYDEKKNYYLCELDPIMEKVEISIYLGDDQWGPKSIHVIPRPKIINFMAMIQPPSYTNKTKETTTSGNMQVFEGSIVDFELTADKDLKSFDFINLSQNNKKIALTSKSARTWTFQYILEENIKYTFQMVDNEDLNSHDMPIYTLSVERDKAPAIKILRPIQAIEVSPVTKVPVQLQIVDNFKVTRYRIVAQTVSRNEQGEEILKGQPKVLVENNKVNQKVVEYTGLWSIAQNGATPGERVKMWVEAWDNHEKEPLLMRSQDIYVSVITVDEYRLRLMTRMGDVSNMVDNLKTELEGSNRSLENLNK